MFTATACRPRVGRGGRPESPGQARGRRRRAGLVDIALCRVLSDAGLRRSEAAALVWERRCGVGRRLGPADGGAVEDRCGGTHGLPDAGVAMEALGKIRPGDANRATSVFGLSAPSIARRIRAAAAAAGPGVGLFGAFGQGGHGAAHGCGRRAHA